MDGGTAPEVDAGPTEAELRSVLARLILDLRAGHVSRSQLAAALQDADYEPSTARALISAQRRQSTAYLFGSVTDRLHLTTLGSALLFVFADIEGDFELSGRSGCNVVIAGEVAGDLTVADASAGELLVSGQVQGRIRIVGSIAGNLRIDGSVSQGIWIPGAIAGDLVIAGWIGGLWIFGSVFGGVKVIGTVSSELVVGKQGRDGRWHRCDIWGDVDIPGVVRGNLRVEGRIRGVLRLTGQVTNEVALAGELHDDVWVGGQVDEVKVLGEVLGKLTFVGVVTKSIHIGGGVAGRVAMSGTVSGPFVVTGGVGPLWLTGRFGAEVVIRPDWGADGDARVKIVSMMRASFAADVQLGDHVDISGCDLRQVSDFRRLQLVGAHLFPSDHQYLSNPPDSWHEPIPDVTMESTYRQLRLNLEASHQRRLAAALFVEEMEARRRVVIERNRFSGQRLLLSCYRWLSMYSTSVGRPLLWFVAVAILGAGFFTAGDLVISGSGETASAIDTLTFSVQSMLSAFWPPVAQLSGLGQWVQIGLRLTGPLLFVQFVLAIRSRIGR